MTKFTFLLFLITGISMETSFAQRWVARFNGTGNGQDAITAMTVDKAGNVYETGYAFDGTVNDNDYVTIKYNTSGVRQWMIKYNGPGSGSDIPTSVFVDDAGFVYVTGSSDALAGQYIDNDAATVKYSPQGVQLWVARYAGALARADAGNAVKADAAGNVYIAGYTTVHVLGQKEDYLTIKYNSFGIQQWISTYQGIGRLNGEDDAAIGLALDPSGNVYVTGFVFSGTGYSGRTDYLTVKYNSSGVQQWTQQYNGPLSSFDYPTAIAADAAGNVYITGYSDGIDFDFATIKYNTSGVQQWLARYNGPANSFDLAYDLALDNAGNVYVTGSDQKVVYNSDYLTVKYNSAGVQLWTARYNGPANDNDESYAVALDKAGNVYVTGATNGFIGNTDIATVKYSSSGVQKWVKTYSGPKDSADAGRAIGIDSLGNVYVSGTSAGKTTEEDFVTIRYQTGQAQTTSEVIASNQETLFTNFPNPFVNETKINFTIDSKEPTGVKLSVFDIQGKEVAVLMNEKLNAGTYRVSWNADQFPAGIYFCKLQYGQTKELRKLMLMK